MQAKIIEQNENTMTVEVVIPAETVEKEFNKIYRDIVHRYNIPGFRKGKAPRKIVEMRIGKDFFISEAKVSLINESYPQALKELNLNPVGHEILDVDLDSEKPMTYRVKVEMEPTLQLKDYKAVSVELEKGKFDCKEEFIDGRLEELRNQHKKVKEVEEARPLKDGDIAIIDYTGTVDGKEFAGGSAKDYSLKIGSKSFIEGFEEQCIGMKTGETKTIDVTFPESYQEKSLAGKPAQFTVILHEIKEEIMPELNDDFAKEAGEYKTLQELKDDIKKDFTEYLSDAKKSEVLSQVFKTIIENNSFDVPKSMVENELDRYLEDFENRLKYQFPNLTLSKYLSYTGTSVEKLREDARKDCEHRVKCNLVLKAVAEAEKIELTDDEYKKEVEKTAEAFRQTPEEFEAMLDKNGTKEIFSDNLRREKARDLLFDTAKITEVEKKEEPEEQGTEKKKTTRKAKKTDETDEKEVEKE